jgi:hypothetical protein
MNKYKKRGIIIGLFIYLAISMIFSISAEEVYKKNTPINYLEPCVDGIPTAGCTCTLSVTNPDGTPLITNGAMNDLGTGWYNYTFTPSQIGNHKLTKSCAKGSLNATEYGEIDITYTGKNLTGSKVSIYMIGLVFLVIIGTALGLLAHRINGEDARGEDGSILSINNLKFVKPIIWTFVWMIGIACLWIIANMGIAFLPDALIGNLFFTLFRIALWATIIGIPVYFIYLFVKFMESREFQKMIERGVDLKSDVF